MSTDTTYLTLNQWQPLAEEHRSTVKNLTEDYSRRISEGKRHPVWDFLFHYYPLTPGKLAHWHPGARTAVEAPEGDLPAPFGSRFYTVNNDGYIQLDTQALWDAREDTFRFIHSLLSRTLGRKAQLACFGLHEWAMVYKDTPRHPEPLRLGAEATDDVVENHTINCTHYDAFRFFTPAAVKRNQNTPTRKTQTALEQPGCLHATMDVYKWVIKLGPLVPGEMLLQSFVLACDVRRLDMEASPYDLKECGFDPVKIETAEGKAEYVRRQKELMARGQELRTEIIELMEGIYPQLASSHHLDNAQM